MRAETRVYIEVKPHHLFRYPSEWDPRQNGKTKGGYLEGQIRLPDTGGNLRLLLSTYPDVPHSFDKVPLSPAEREIHPTLLHVVRKGQGNRRYNSKEPVPNIHHWQQEFEVRGRKVFICNKTSENDEGRAEAIPERDEMFTLGEDMVLRVGKDAGELNMIILIPKTEKRANGNDVSLNKLLQSRTQNSTVLEALSQNYRGKNSVNLKKVKLKVEVFDLDSGMILGSSISRAISDTASKTHGAMDLHDATPLSSCANGGRKVVMLAEFGLAKDVWPRFQLYNQEGRRMSLEEEALLRQPEMTDVSIMRESIVFITPPQPNVEVIRRQRYSIKLVARRCSDGYVSKKKFNFDYLPHDYYDPCFFCFENPDNNPESSRAKLVPMKEVARPGLRKRQMSVNDTTEVTERKIRIKGEDIRILNMNRPPVIKTTTSISDSFQRMLPTLKLLPMSLLQKPNGQNDASDNIQKTPTTTTTTTTATIKTEPIDGTDPSTSSSSPIPFHDMSNNFNLLRTFPSSVVTTSTPSSLIISSIKMEL